MEGGGGAEDTSFSARVACIILAYLVSITSGGLECLENVCKEESNK